MATWKNIVIMGKLRWGDYQARISFGTAPDPQAANGLLGNADPCCGRGMVVSFFQAWKSACAGLHWAVPFLRWAVQWRHGMSHPISCVLGFQTPVMVSGYRC